MRVRIDQSLSKTALTSSDIRSELISGLALRLALLARKLLDEVPR
jgi:hypothetical protein